MLISGLSTKPVRALAVVAVLGFFWIWLSNIQGVRLSDDLLPSYYRGHGSGRSWGSKPTSRIGKVTVAANKLDNGVIDRALKSHERHNALHGYVHHIARNQAVSSLIENDRYRRPKGAWTKPAYLLSVIVDELEKDPEDRLQWIYWFDADTIIMNLETPLDMFLPPVNSTSLGDVDLIITTNWDGLNSGVFAMRVCPWSVSLLSAVLAYPIYEAPRMEKDRFRDQSAFQFLLEHKESPLAETPMQGRDHWVKVPMRWFNSLPVNNAFYKNGTWVFAKNMTHAMFDNGTNEVYDDGHDGKVNPWKVMQGDMVVHFAGSSNVRDSWMEPWVTRAEALLPEWNNATTQVVLKEEVAAFWNKTEEQMTVDKAKSKVEEAEKARLKKQKQKEEKKAKEEKEKKEKERLEKERMDKERKVEEEEKKRLQKEELAKNGTPAKTTQKPAGDSKKVVVTVTQVKTSTATPAAAGSQIPPANSTLHQNSTVPHEKDTSLRQ